MATTTKAKLKLTTTSPKPIVDTFCLIVQDVSKTPKVNDTGWQNLVSPLRALSVEFMYGSQATHGRYIETNANCYNYDAAIEALRVPPQTIANINQGICNRVYGYGFYQDTIGYVPKLSPMPEMVITINLAEPILRKDYQPTFNQIDYVMRSCPKVRCVQLCYETGIQANADIFPTSDSIKAASQTVADYVTTHYPNIPLSGDCNIVDDATARLKDLNTKQNSLVGVTQFRQYFQKDQQTYTDARSRVATFSSFCDKFQSQFPGKKMRIAQAVVKPTSPLIGTIAEPLLYAEEIFAVINENINRGNLITDYNVEIGRCVSGASRINISYNFMKLIRGAQQNDGLITAEYIDTPGSENLLTIAVKKGIGTQTFILNPTATAIPLEAVRVDEKKKSVHAEGYYGNAPTDTVAQAYSYDGIAITVPGYSLTRIDTDQVGAS